MQKAPKTAQKTLDKAQEKAQVRTISTIERVEERFNLVLTVFNLLGINKYELVGLKVEYTEGVEQFPNAYRGTPMGTCVVGVYDGKAWKLERAYRANCNRGYDIFWVFKGIKGRCNSYDLEFKYAL